MCSDSPSSRYVAIFVGVASITLLTAADAIGGPITYLLDAGAYGAQQQISNAAGSVTSERVIGSAIRHATAKAGPKGLGAFAYMKGPIGQVDIGARGSATMWFDDLIISNPDNPGATFVDVVLNLHLTFSSTLATQPFETGAGGLYTGVQLDVRSAAKAFTRWGAQLAGATREGSLYVCAESRPGGLTWDGMCSNNVPGASYIVDKAFGWDPNQSGISAAFTVPVGKPLNGSLSLSAAAFIEGFGITIAGADYANTLSFVQGSPVFTLPPGFTANSESLQIVNNYWGGQPSAVPEPASILLLGTAIAGMAARRKMNRN